MSSSSMRRRSATCRRTKDPHHFSEGVLDVIVNGAPVLRDGAMTNALPGKVLRGRGYRTEK